MKATIHTIAIMKVAINININASVVQHSFTPMYIYTQNGRHILIKLR